MSAYNETSKNFRLIWAGNDYSHFDFWLMPSNPQQPPRLVELKYHRNKLSTDREYFGCDLLKIQRLLMLKPPGSKAYVFHLFQDQTLVQDCETPVERYVETEFAGQTVVLGLIHRRHALMQLSIGADDLLLRLDPGQRYALSRQNQRAIAQETLAPEVPHDSPW